LFIVRRTTEGACATFHPAVDFDDEGQGGIRSLGPGHVRCLRAWPGARQRDGFAAQFCATRRFRRACSSASGASWGPARHERTGAIRKGWFARKTCSARTKRDVEAVLTVTGIAAIIVQASRAQYHAGGRPCACPDDTMRNGRACGGRSTYSRPSGASPLCYPGDVTAAMIESYRQRTASRQALGR
jgi:hypothetical protein